MHVSPVYAAFRNLRFVCLVNFSEVKRNFAFGPSLMLPPRRSAFVKISGSELKGQKKMMTLTEMIQLLNMLKEGRSFFVVARHYSINE